MQRHLTNQSKDGGSIPASELFFHAGDNDSAKRLVKRWHYTHRWPSLVRDVLVLAGAGAGKTKVLVQRIAHLIRERNQPPESILALTFTRKAALEMQTRLAALGVNTEGARIGTFHAVSLDIVREHAAKLEYDGDRLTVLEPADQIMLLDRVQYDLGLSTKISGAKVAGMLDAIYAGQVNIDDLEPYESLTIKEYWSRLKQYNVLDFGMILRECFRLLTDFPNVLATYHETIRHVLVDEVQDTDAIQYRLHEFFSPPATFFAVGDFRQTIYGWRGARPDLLLKNHPGAEVHHLNECFRCGDRIVERANKLIAVNNEPLCEPMVGATGRRGIVGVFTGRSDGICARAIDLHDTSAYDWKDIAVIARSHRELKCIAALCEERKIPRRHVGAEFDVCATDGFCVLHAALKLLTNPRDMVAAIRVRGASRELAAVVNELHDSGAIDERTQIFVALDALKRGYAPWRFEAAETFWLRTCKYSFLGHALRWFAQRDHHTPLETSDAPDELTLITAHAAKGLEWPAVIVANCVQGSFPNSRALRLDDLSEERRVFYVACTRASEQLWLHWRSSEDQADDRPTAEPSQFLFDMEVFERAATKQ